MCPTMLPSYYPVWNVMAATLITVDYYWLLLITIDKYSVGNWICTQIYIEEIESITKMYGQNHLKFVESFNALGLAYQYISKNTGHPYILSFTKTDYLQVIKNIESTALKTGVILNDLVNTYNSLGDTQNVTVAFHGALDTFRSTSLSNARVLSTMNQMDCLKFPFPTENKEIKSNVMKGLPVTKSGKVKILRWTSKIPHLRRLSSAPCQDHIIKLKGLSKRDYVSLFYGLVVPGYGCPKCMRFLTSCKNF